MDRLIHTVGNALTNLRDTQIISAQNLANQSVTGYRRDMSCEGSTVFAMQLDGLGVRAFQQPAESYSFSEDSGFLDQTGEPLDIAIADKGYFYVKPEEGPPALTRRGDLRVDLRGRLLNGAGEEVLDAQQAPIVVPPFTDIVVNEIGELSIQPPDAPPGERVLVATLGTYVPDGTQVLRKGEDGQIRLENGQVPPSNQLAEVRQGVLERSNVNTTDELINAIDLQRGFELNMKMVSEAKRLDEAAGSLVKLPEG